MLITVFHAKDPETSGMVLIAYPTGTEPVVADKHKTFEWHHLASTSIKDRMFAAAQPIILAQIDINGYAFLRLA